MVPEVSERNVSRHLSAVQVTMCSFPKLQIMLPYKCTKIRFSYVNITMEARNSAIFTHHLI